MAGLFVMLLALLSMGLILFQNRIWSIYIGLIVGITYSIIFGVTSLSLVGIFILVMLFFHAQDAVNGEIQERIKMNSQVLIRKGLSNFVISFFILASFAAYQSPAITTFKDIQELPSASSVFIRSIVAQTLSGQLDEVPESQQETVLNQVTREITREANLYLKPYFQYVPPVLAFGLFLLLYSVGWLFIWLAVGIGMLLFQFLKKAKFFKIDYRDVKAQSIVI